MNQLLAMRAFVRVVETGSFRRAAEELGLPRSSVSKLVSDLEHHLGGRLVQRTTRQVMVTAEGLAYHEHAVRLLGQLDEADDAVRGDGLRPRGTLRLDVPAAIAHHLLIPALPAFAERCPEIVVVLGIGDRQVNIIGEGADCVIRGGDLGDPALIAMKLIDLQYGTYAAPAYLARYGVPETPTQLAVAHAVVGYHSSNTARVLPMVFEREGERVVVDKVAFAANDGEAQLAMMRQGLGIGQHFKRIAQPLVDAGVLVEVLPQWTRPAFPLHAVYPPGRLRTARLEAFLDWLMDTFRAQPDRTGAISRLR